jgi:hypothetical protein
MIRIGTGVDDVANGFGRNFLDCGNDGIGARGQTRIDNDDAISPNLDGHVTAGARNEVEIGPELQNFEFTCVSRTNLLRLR